MEYTIYITYRCNLRCSFCYAKDRLSTNKKNLTASQANKIINYIASDNPKEEKIITFMGGEPLIADKVIKNFINKSKKYNWLYAMYTNGLLLNKTPSHVLDLFDIILVSIDGDKKAQEKHKGEGTYGKVMKNLKILRPKIKAKIIGRITLTEETNILQSVKNLLTSTDAVYWQIVNKPKFSNTKRLIDNYKKNLQKLFNFWLLNLEQGRILNIIPFQIIVLSLIYNYPKNKLSFRCGAGSNLKVIDINGNMYWCDEHIGNKNALIGNANSSPKLKYHAHTSLFADCKKCEVSDICRGRCKRMLNEFSNEQIKNYCQMTKYLIKVVKKKEKKIKNILKTKRITLKQFYNIPDYMTEEIP